MDISELEKELSVLKQKLVQVEQDRDHFKNLWENKTYSKEKKIKSVNFFKLPPDILSNIYSFDDSFKRHFSLCLHQANLKFLYHRIFLSYIRNTPLKPYFVDLNDPKNIQYQIFFGKEEKRHFRVSYKTSCEMKEVLDVSIFEENDPRLRYFLALEYLNPNCIPDLFLSRKFKYDLFDAYMMKRLFDTNTLIHKWNLKDPMVREEFLGMNLLYYNDSYFDILQHGEIPRDFYFRKMYECVSHKSEYGNYFIILSRDH